MGQAPFFGGRRQLGNSSGGPAIDAAAARPPSLRMDRLRALCSACNEGSKNANPEPSSCPWLPGRVRIAAMKGRKAIFAWLKARLGKSWEDQIPVPALAHNFAVAAGTQ